MNGRRKRRNDARKGERGIDIVKKVCYNVSLDTFDDDNNNFCPDTMPKEPTRCRIFQENHNATNRQRIRC